jgi:hypothetical protein
MIGDLRKKRNIELKSKRALENRLENLANRETELVRENRVAIMEDMDKRFADYNTDLSIGDMYQRKKKSVKSKSKRKKSCGCK